MGNGSNTCDSESLLASCAVPGTVVEDQPDLLLTCYYDEKENTPFFIVDPWPSRFYFSCNIDEYIGILGQTAL